MGRRSREKRERREHGPAPASARDAGRRRALVGAAIVAAIVGLALGWLVRLWVDRPPSPESEAAKQVRERVLEKTR